MTPAPQNARAVLDRSMDEESLLVAITDALTVYQWRWVHFRRSDRAQMMGHKGLPDVIAARRGRVLFWELKSAKGAITDEQWAWLDALGWLWDPSRPKAKPAVEINVITPADLDAALAELARP